MFILESEQGKPFKVKGIFMKKDSISKNAYRYSGALVEKTVKVIQEAIKSDGAYPISMMADHPGISANKTLSVVGKVTAAYMENDNAILEAEIANTSAGKDVQELIKGEFVKGLSIRASNAKYKGLNIGGKMVKDVLEMELKGVDLVVNPGVTGAKITDIIESDQSGSSNLYISIDESEEIPENNNVLNEEEKTLDLKELKEKYPDLVESLKQEFKTIMESEDTANTLQGSVNSLTSERDAISGKLEESEKAKTELTESVKDLQGKLEEAEGKLKEIAESEAKAKRDTHIATKLGELKFADSVKAKLKEKVEVLESVEDIDKVLEAEVEFLNMVIQESTGVIKGKGHTGDNGTKKTSKLQEEEDFINKVMGS